MAACDYRSCDVCSGKTFYDANLNYEFGDKVDGPEAPYKVCGIEPGKFGVALDRLGDWAVLCKDCAKTHRTAILQIEQM